MSTEQNKTIICRFFDLFNQRDLDSATALLADTFVAHMAGAPGPMDRTAFRQMGEMYLAAFPDGKQTIEDLVAEGDKVVNRHTFSGTQRGEMMGIPATGKQVAMSSIVVDRLVDGKIVERWVEYDAMGMMQQLGVIPTPGQ